MIKFTIIVILAIIACAAAKPGILDPVAFSSPFIAAAPGVVTASSSQIVARNYNGIASAPIYAAPLTARYLASPYAVPLATAPFAANYIASASLRYSAPLVNAPLGYASPLRYAPSAPLLL